MYKIILLINGVFLSINNIKLDIEYIRALETSSDTSTIVSKKNDLRNATAAAGISTATSIAELKAQWDTSILGASPYT